MSTAKKDGGVFDSREKKGNNFQMPLSQKSKYESLLKTDNEQNEYVHLSDFLKNHINRQKQKISKIEQEEDTITEISRKNKYNNALIERASREVREQRGKIKNNSNSETHLEKARSIAYEETDKLELEATSPDTKKEVANDLLSRKSYISNTSETKNYMSKRLSKTFEQKKALKNHDQLSLHSQA